MSRKKDKIIINEKIRGDEVRVVDQDGENIGVKPRDEALELAKTRGLDLILIAPQANPPVAKIYSYDKFRYEKEKETQKEKKKKKNKDMKRVQITPRSAKNDLETKVRRAEEFLNDGHRVDVFIFLKGREKANKDFAKRKLEEFLEMIEVPFNQVMAPKYSGSGFSTHLVSDE